MNVCRGRIYYFDFLRGVAIIMVVGIHTYSSNQTIDDGISSILQIIIRTTFNCAVPLFLAISGFFIAKKDLTTFSACKSFWKKQIPTVYMPCLIFSIPWFVISCISINFKLEGVLKNFIELFLCGYSIYYFIALIIECYILAPWLVRHNNVNTLIFIALLSVFSAWWIEYFSVFQHYDFPLVVQGSFPILLIFFYIGIYLSTHSRNYSLCIPIILILFGLILGICHMDWIYNNFGLMRVGQKVTLYIFDVGVILFCMSSKIEKNFNDNLITRIVLYIGEISFGIYFTHIYLIFIADRFFPWMRNYWIVLWLFSLLLTIVIIEICKKISPTLSQKYLGYR